MLYYTKFYLQIMSKIRLIILFFTFVFSFHVYGLNIKILLLSDFQVNTVDVNVLSGTYSVLCDNVKIFPTDLKTESAVTLTYFEGKIRMERGFELIGFFSEIEFIGTKYNNVFSLKTHQLPQARIYEDNLKIVVSDSKLMTINTISLEKYVAGVVQSEATSLSFEILHIITL